MISGDSSLMLNNNLSKFKISIFKIIKLSGLFINTAVKIAFVIFKLSLILSILTFGVIISVILKIVLFFSNKWFYIKINTKYVIRPISRTLLFFIGVKVTRPKDITISNAIIVSNHWGYLDSLLLMALFPSMVISNVDVKQMPVVGRIMTMMGFVFVNRQNNNSIPAIIEKSTEIMNNTDLSIAFFPEGGTGDGFKLRRFNSSFFELALTAKKNVIPVVIRIETINDEAPNQDNMNQVVFHNSQENILKHSLKLLQLKSIAINVTVLPQISYYEIHSKYLLRKHICMMAEKRISNFIDENKRC
jgi:1-acyl-sn-glycerol-3-phosphate acyltransferase